MIRLVKKNARIVKDRKALPGNFSKAPEYGEALTSWHDVVDARFELSALVIAAPAKESTVVQFGHRRVGGRRVCMLARDVRLSYVHRLHCIIEFPGERYFRRVRLQLAGDARGLLPRHAEYLRLPVLAYRHD